SASAVADQRWLSHPSIHLVRPHSRGDALKDHAMMALMMIAAAAAQPALAAPPLQPLALLVGHCWTGPAPGNAGIDKHCFDSIYGGQHVRDRHSVIANGEEVYAGESIYSAKGVQVIFTYWNSLGGLGTGEAALD